MIKWCTPVCQDAKAVLHNSPTPGQPAVEDSYGTSHLTLGEGLISHVPRANASSPTKSTGYLVFHQERVQEVAWQVGLIFIEHPEQTAVPEDTSVWVSSRSPHAEVHELKVSIYLRKHDDGKVAFGVVIDTAWAWRCKNSGMLSIQCTTDVMKVPLLWKALCPSSRCFINFSYRPWCCRCRSHSRTHSVFAFLTTFLALSLALSFAY